MYNINCIKLICLCGEISMKLKIVFFKFFSLVVAAALTLAFSSCYFRVAINDSSRNKETTVTSVQNETTSAENSTVSSEDSVDSIEKIEATEPDLSFGQSEIELLQSYGLDESYLRKQYTFDENDLNGYNNKAYVLDRMCNSIDYFTTLQASYTLHTQKNNQKSTWTTYAIDRRIGKAKELIYSVTENDSKCVPLSYVCVDGDYHLKTIFSGETKDENTLKYVSPLADDNKTIKNVAQLFEQPLADKLESVTDKPQINSYTSAKDDVDKYIDVTKKQFIINGLPTVMFTRSDKIGLIYAGEHYNPQFFAVDAMMNFSNWEIESVDTNNNGNDIICILGKYYDKIDNTKKRFNLKIDKETGVMISKQVFNSSGKVIEDYNTLNIIIDGEIKSDIFDSIKP